MSMNSEEQYRDDFKKVFDASQVPDLPIQLEEKIMAGVEIQKLRSKRRAPYWFTTNMVMFSLSIFIFVLLSVVQFMTEWNLAFISDLTKVAILTTVVFFILWLVETADTFLQLKFKEKVQTNLE